MYYCYAFQPKKWTEFLRKRFNRQKGQKGKGQKKKEPPIMEALPERKEKMSHLEADCNIVSFLCILFLHGFGQNQKICKQYCRFLLHRARRRGFRGKILLALKKGDLIADRLVSIIGDLSTYICVHDIDVMIETRRRNQQLEKNIWIARWAARQAAYSDLAPENFDYTAAR